MKPNRSGLRRIQVKGLFDAYDYAISAEDGRPGQRSDLIILYGSNGCGKTTLLKLIFHMISGWPGQGHKGKVAQIPFREVAIELFDGTKVTAIRHKKTVGPFEMHLIRPDGEVAHAEFPTIERDGIRVRSNPDQEPLLDELRALNLSFHYLSDDRRMQQSFGDDRLSNDDISSDRALRNMLMHGYREGDVREYFEELETQKLRSAITRLEGWIRSQVLSSSAQGETNINQIYRQVLGAIVDAETNRSLDEPAPSLPQLMARVNALDERSDIFSELGFARPFPSTELLGLIERGGRLSRKTFAVVLDAYLSSAEAKLDALQDVHRVVESLIESVNSFYSGKSLCFNMMDGLRVFSHYGAEIYPSMLSSGERQLLLLLCSAVVARDQPTVFLIDEPELSLNVKWQRDLVHALLSCTESAQVQFVMATHSIELLTRYSSDVETLSSDI